MGQTVIVGSLQCCVCVYKPGPVDYALLYTVYKVQPVLVSHCWTKVKTRSARSITSSSLMFERKKNRITSQNKPIYLYIAASHVVALSALYERLALF